jgi:hypothetical protein
MILTLIRNSEMFKKVILSLLMSQIASEIWCCNSSYYDEGEFKGYTFGKGFKPNQDQSTGHETNFTSPLKYDKYLGYHFEVDKNAISQDEKKLVISNKQQIEKNTEVIEQSSQISKNQKADQSPLETQSVISQ